ncbi:hypothetical protein N0V88_000003 [Collariella sp. IMI 366227]|nr:hypothetical protein N0V88_000003 [Collariella sp. IMI 366227]
MSLRSQKPASQRGFFPIAGSGDSTMTDLQDIPLQTVRSHASSTGARQHNMENMDEKHALFDKAVGGPGGGRRRIHKDLARAGSSNLTEEAKLNAMGRLYKKIVNFSVITRYLVYVVPVVLLLAIPIIVLPITGDKDRVRLGDGKRHSLFLLFVWIEISWLTLWAGKLAAHFLPFLFMFFCGVISSGTRKYATVLRALEIPLSLFFWGLASWLSFKFMWKGANREWSKTIERIILSLFLSSAVLLAEKFLVQLISISYHQRSFANRIGDSKREIFLLGLMYEASRALFPMYCRDFAHEDYVIADSIEARVGAGVLNKEGVAAKPMKLVGEVGRLGDKITSVFGNLASEITGKQVFNPNSAHSIVVEALEKVRSSEAMARRIWCSFVAVDSDSLSKEDILFVMGEAHREEAEECFEAIDADQNGDISQDEMIRKVVEIGKERKAIANSMKDISQALAVFDKVLLFVVVIVVIIIFLAVFQSSFIATLTTAGTTLLSLSFVFAVTTQEFLGSCIFLFVKHPYDVGDRVDITGPEKEQLTVEKISLLYTVFTRIDKMQVVQVPNIQLNNLWIENVTRSKAMRETIDVNVSFDTTFEDIELLQAELETFVRHPDNSRDFQPDLAIGVGSVGDCDKLTLKIAIKHKSNWHNDTVRATRRSKFMCALTMALKRVPINGPGGGGDDLGGPANPTYSVAVTDDFAAQARAASQKGKLDAKLANQATEDDSASTTAEQRAADHLNTTDPVVEALDDWGYENTLPATSRDTLAPGALHSAMEDGSGLHLTRTSTSTHRGDKRSFDIERHAGFSPTLGTSSGIHHGHHSSHLHPVQGSPSASPYNTYTVYNNNGQPQQQAGQMGQVSGVIDAQQQQPLAPYPSAPPAMTGSSSGGASVADFASASGDDGDDGDAAAGDDPDRYYCSSWWGGTRPDVGGTGAREGVRKEI